MIHVGCRLNRGKVDSVPTSFGFFAWMRIAY